MIPINLSVDKDVASCLIQLTLLELDCNAMFSEMAEGLLLLYLLGRSEAVLYNIIVWQIYRAETRSCRGCKTIYLIPILMN